LFIPGGVVTGAAAPVPAVAGFGCALLPLPAAALAVGFGVTGAAEPAPIVGEFMVGVGLGAPGFDVELFELHASALQMQNADDKSVGVNARRVMKRFVQQTDCDDPHSINRR
jgi:hypothetical protein